MKCSEFRPQCMRNQEVEPGDQFCRFCGAALSTIRLRREMLSLRPGIAQATSLHYSASGQAVQHGSAKPSSARLRVVSPDEGVILSQPSGVKGKTIRVVAEPGGPTLRIGLEIAADAELGSAIEIEVMPSEKVPDEHMPWVHHLARPYRESLTLVAPGTARPMVAPERVVFRSEAPREVAVTNASAALIQVERLEVTGPFSIDGQIARGFALAPKRDWPSPVRIELAPEEPGRAASGCLILHLAGDEAPMRVPLSYLPPEDGGLEPDFTVGIDFGTSGTSVFVRPHRFTAGDENGSRSGPAEALGDFVHAAKPTGEDSNRFPTAIYLRDGGWKYGRAAVTAWEQDGKPANRLITDLKSLLRRGVETAAGESTHRFLRWYLGELLRDLVGRTARTLRPDLDISACRFSFVFTVPVGDSNAYGEGVRRAAVEAGYAKLGSIATVEEPLAALLSALHRGLQVPSITDGDPEPQPMILPDRARVLLFDSGAGTTDIAVATVRRQGSRVWLEDLSTRAFRVRPDANLDFHDFGGLFVSTAFARSLLRNAEAEKRGSTAVLQSVADVRAAYNLSWRQNQQLAATVDSAKVLLSNGGKTASVGHGAETVDAKAATFHSAMRALADRCFVPRQTDDAIENRLDDILRVAEADGAPIKYVVSVGGNSALRALRAAIREVGASHGATYLEFTDPAMRLEAVAMGSVCTRDNLPRGLPFDAVIRFEDANGKVVHTEELSAFDPTPRIRPLKYNMAAGSELVFEMTALEEPKYVVCRVPFRHPTHQRYDLELNFRIERGQLTITDNLPGSSPAFIQIA